MVPFPADRWEAIWQELQWQMDRGVFLRWWRDVKPFGLLSRSGEAEPCVVLGVPSAEALAWIEAKQMPMVRRTVSGVWGEPVEVRIEVYAQTVGQLIDVVTL
jgi:chromosomal replication initiation ATPase DnaA